MKMALSKAPPLLLLAFLFSVGLLVSARELAEKTASTVGESKYYGSGGGPYTPRYSCYRHHGCHGGHQLPERKLAAEEAQVKPEHYRGGYDGCYGHGCYGHGGDGGGGYEHGGYRHHGGYGGGGGYGHGGGGYGGPEVKETAKGN